MDTATSSYRYRVSSIEIVEPRDTGVLAGEKTPELTLVTCYPFSYVGTLVGISMIISGFSRVTVSFAVRRAAAAVA